MEILAAQQRGQQQAHELVLSVSRVFVVEVDNSHLSLIMQFVFFVYFACRLFQENGLQI